MCGIVGYVGLELTPEAGGALLERMRETVVHRGPDDHGQYVAPGVGLAMQRLSILDLAHGHQPMASSDDQVQIVYNGEIYNHAAIRERLEREGHEFSTHCDTEVVLQQYLARGPEGITELNGMFAIAIWDARARKLFLARDRLGVKPLYYAWDGQRLLFASEIKALIASDLVERRVEPCALWDYLTFRYVPAPETIWQGVHKLPPAHSLSLLPDGRGPQLRRYWDSPYTEREWAGVEELSFATVFEDAVRLRMIADVPVGILLSGGLDSSCVAAAAVAERTAPISTFTVAFEDARGSDEREYARQVSGALGTDHHEVVIGEREFLEFLEELVYFTDEPLADLASVPLNYVCKLARENVKVVLSGEGSDEVLGGYDFDRLMQHWASVERARRRTRWMGGTRSRRLLAKLVPVLRESVELATIETDQARIASPLHMTNYMTSDDKRQLLRIDRNCDDSSKILRSHLSRVPGEHPLHQCLYLYCQDWLVEDLLMKADRMSMANSLELRTPFLDYRVVEWAAKAPLGTKVSQDAAGTWLTKRVLRDYARSRIPGPIIERPKQGFPVPVYEWLRGQLRPWIVGLLDAKSCEIRRWFQPEELDRIVKVGLSPDAQIHDLHRLWNLAVLELWTRRWSPV